MRRPKVIAAIAYHGELTLIRRSVESVLRQHHAQIDAVVVVNDSHTLSPSTLLKNVDPRVVTLDLNLGSSRGPFFAWEVVQRTLPTDALMVTIGADDRWHPQLLRTLLDEMRSGVSTVAPSILEIGADGLQSVWHFGPNDDISSAPASNFPMRNGVRIAPIPDIIPGPRNRWRLPMLGLVSVDTMRSLGGWYGGERYGWDPILGNLLLMHGGAKRTDKALYQWIRRPKSLTTSAETQSLFMGNSPERNAINGRMQELYDRIYPEFLRLRPDLNPEQQKRFAGLVANEIAARVSPEHRQELREAADQLRPELSGVLAIGQAVSPVARAATSEKALPPLAC